MKLHVLVMIPLLVCLGQVSCQSCCKFVELLGFHFTKTLFSFVKICRSNVVEFPGEFRKILQRSLHNASEQYLDDYVAILSKFLQNSYIGIRLNLQMVSDTFSSYSLKFTFYFAKIDKLFR